MALQYSWTEYPSAQLQHSCGIVLMQSMTGLKKSLILATQNNISSSLKWQDIIQLDENANNSALVSKLVPTSLPQLITAHSPVDQVKSLCLTAGGSSPVGFGWTRVTSYTQ